MLHNKIARNCMIDVLLGDILGIKWIFDDLKCGKQKTLDQLSSKFRRQDLESRQFVRALTNQYIDALQEPETIGFTKYLMESILNFCKELYSEWRVYQLTIISNKTQDNLLVQIKPCLETIFLSFTMLFHQIATYFQDYDIVIALNIYSYLDFCRIDFPIYQDNLKTLYDKLMLSGEYEQGRPTPSEELVSLLPASPLIQPEIVIEDQVELSRLYFLLSVLKKTIHLVSDQAIETRLLGTLFA